ncbi:hypothetical protein DPMN_159511 [Dreissena polymorpha]|uniref:Uncharacterized protein n=1 Tax=Dreissena polymorpha TaxID=45954 RepID=A0A9D4IMW7_DREPO|nr:hypothetical protein DPMN_159511 [Dreissena polymorpha]
MSLAISLIYTRAHAFILDGRSEADPVYEETILRSDLLKMIGRLFPHDFHDDEAYKLQLSDSVIKCVQAATEVRVRASVIKCVQAATEVRVRDLFIN